VWFSIGLLSRRIQAVNRLDRLLSELTPGKVKKDITALKAKAIMSGRAGMTLPLSAVADLVARVWLPTVMGCASARYCLLCWAAVCWSGGVRAWGGERVRWQTARHDWVRRCGTVWVVALAG
jgi:hypothetical protein